MAKKIVAKSIRQTTKHPITFRKWEDDRECGAKLVCGICGKVSIPFDEGKLRIGYSGEWYLGYDKNKNLFTIRCNKNTSAHPKSLLNGVRKSLKRSTIRHDATVVRHIVR